MDCTLAGTAANEYLAVSKVMCVDAAPRVRAAVRAEATVGTRCAEMRHVAAPLRGFNDSSAALGAVYIFLIEYAPLGDLNR